MDYYDGLYPWQEQERHKWTKSRALDQLITRQDTILYIPVAIDAANIYNEFIRKSKIYQKLKYKACHQLEWPQFERCGNKYFNEVICDFFFQVYHLLKNFEKDEVIVVFDGRIPNFKKNYQAQMYQEQEDQGPATMQWEKAFRTYWKQMKRKMKFVIIRNLKAAEVEVQVAPFQADHQIVRLFQESKIFSVFSKDYGYFFYDIPIIKSYHGGQRCKVIDLKRFQVDPYMEPSQLRKFIESLQKNHADIRMNILAVVTSHTVRKMHKLTLKQTLELASKHYLCNLPYFFKLARDIFGDRHRTSQNQRDQANVIQKYLQYALVWNKDYNINNHKGRLEYLFHQDGVGNMNESQQKLFGPRYNFDQDHFVGQKDVFNLKYVNQQKRRINVKGKSRDNKIDQLITNPSWLYEVDPLNLSDSESEDEQSLQQFESELQRDLEKMEITSSGTRPQKEEELLQSFSEPKQKQEQEQEEQQEEWFYVGR